MFNKSMFVASALLAVLVGSSPALAGRVLRVTPEAALDGSVPLVVHSEGGGIILDFSPTGEVIEKISLDDPSKIVYDHCLLTKSCGDHPSPTVRLFRSKGISFDDLPSVKATLLTVETLDKLGGWHSYIFPVTTSSANDPATINKVLIGGELPSRHPSRLRGDSASKDVGDSDQAEPSYAVVALGMRQAEQQHLLVDPTLKGRLQTYLQLINAGMSSQLASTKAGVSADLVQHLKDLGRQRVKELTAQQAISTEQVPRNSETAKPKKHKEKKKKNPSDAVQSTSLPSDTDLLKSAASSDSSALPNSTTAIAYNKPPEPNYEKPLIQNASAAVATRITGPVDKMAYANALVRGLNKARLDGKIRYGSKQWRLVNGAVRLLRRGSSLDKAIAVSGMKHEGFMKLLSDGGSES